jgi:hypothetical protein
VEFRIVSVLPVTSPRVASVYRAPVTAPASNVTVPANSLPARFVPAKIIVWLTLDLNVMGAAKDHDPDVEAFVQLPLVTVQDPPAPEVT